MNGQFPVEVIAGYRGGVGRDRHSEGRGKALMTQSSLVSSRGVSGEEAGVSIRWFECADRGGTTGKQEKELLALPLVS